MEEEYTKIDMIYKQLTNFYLLKTNFDKLSSIINPSSQVSLRTIDWFVSKYAESHNLILYWSADGWSTTRTNSNYIDVFSAYNTQLKYHGKKYFDIFKRKNHVNNVIEFNGIKTTFSQLFFCKWIIETRLIDYIWKHADNIRQSDTIKIKSRRITKNSAEIITIIN